MSLNLYKNISKAISNAQSYCLSQSGLYIELTFSDHEKKEENISLLNGLTYDSSLNNTIRLDLDQENFKIFKDIEDFNLRIKRQDIESENIRFSAFILNIDNDSLIYQKDTQETYIDFRIAERNNFFINVISYYKLINFLKSQEHKEDQKFYFVDYFNIDNRKIIVTSLKKEGKLTIGYPQKVPNFDLGSSIKKKIDHFINAFNEKQLPKFIKAELFNYLPTYKKEDRLKAFIDNLDLIMEKAEQNFEIYLSDLSLDKFKSDYLEFRIKYFNQFRDVLSKITTQILAFPLSITAAAFATYKVIDSLALCCIIVVAFTVFTIYSIFMTNAYKQDTDELYRIFINEYNEFTCNPFFSKYPNELTSFNKTKIFIEKRYLFLKRCINVYSIVLILTNSLFIVFILQLMCSLKVSIIIGIIILLILVLFFCVTFFIKS